MTTQKVPELFRKSTRDEKDTIQHGIQVNPGSQGRFYSSEFHQAALMRKGRWKQ